MMEDLISPRGLTAVDGIEVGHATMTGRATGCTVVLTEEGATAGVDVRGSAPGTRETDLLAPINRISVVHGLVFAGGSAFGLDAASGVTAYLEAKGVGWPTRIARVPIVPAAILFDLGVGDDPTIRPDADCGRRAAAAANREPVAEGNVGAGAGASVGKLAGAERAMMGGLGSAALTLEDGVTVATLVVVNAAGDVVDPDGGGVVAGARDDDGGFIDVRQLLRQGRMPPVEPMAAEATTLAVVATDATLTKAQATKVAQMAHDGFARTIVPVHTPWDGDTIFTLATGKRSAPREIGLLGAVAAELVAVAVLRAVRAARPGVLPAASQE